MLIKVKTTGTLTDSKEKYFHLRRISYTKDYFTRKYSVAYLPKETAKGLLKQ